MLKILGDFYRRVKENLASLLIIYSPIILILVVIELQQYIPISELTRDTVDLVRGNIYTGLISDIGIYLWFCSASICFLGALILRHNDHKQRQAIFLVILGTFILWLGIDDRLLVHDKLIDGGEVIYAVYALAAMYFVYNYWDLLMASAYEQFFIALAFLAGSTFVDAIKDLIRLFEQEVIYERIGEFFGTSYDVVYQNAYLLEDGLKLMGIVGLSVFCAMFVYQEIVPEVVEKNVQQNA